MSEFAEPVDVTNLYRLLLGRRPENDAVVTEKVGHSLHSMPTAFLDSEEFRNAILNAVVEQRPWASFLYVDPIDTQLKAWIIRVFDLDDQAGSRVIDASTWIELLVTLYEETAILQVYSGHRAEEVERFQRGLAALQDRAAGFSGVLDTFDGVNVSGWGFDPLRPDEPATIDLLIDGNLVHSLVADELRSDVRKAGLHSGICGFRGKLPLARSETVGKLLSARIRTTGYELAESPRIGKPPAIATAFSEQTTATDPRYADLERALPDLFHFRQIRQRAKIAVVLHLYYQELWDEIADSIDNIKEDIDLFVSLVSEKSDTFGEVIKSRFPDAHVVVFPNHGRDVFPFTEFASTGVLDGYELICKIHSKRSLHRTDGDKWRGELMQGLLGSPLRVSTICKAMRADPDIGLVVPDGYIFGAETIGGNVDGLSKLLNKIGLDADLLNLEYPAGNMFWLNGASLQWIKALALRFTDFEIEDAQLDNTISHAVERFIGVACASSAQKILTPSALLANNPARIGDRHTLVAFYLPQFHPVPQNDHFWGKGFTEWHNVQGGKTLYLGHNQPRQPNELGYYDLRLDEIRHEQARLAKDHGIGAFCYYYYWFDGTPVLDLPIRRLLADTSLDFPFCVCWANENWTRSWDGLNRDVLLHQSYSPDLLPRFAADIAPYLKDARYLRHEGKPLFLLYKAPELPDAKAAVEIWRSVWRTSGVGEVHVAAVRSFAADEYTKPELLGADSFVDFPPHSIQDFARPARLPFKPGFEGFAYHYVKAAEGDLARYATEDSARVHRAVMGSWDNTARRGSKAHLAHGASPITYRSWLRRLLLQDAERNPDGPRLVFINAWNEWAEGTYLEPDQRYGRGYLIATKSALGA